MEYSGNIVGEGGFVAYYSCLESPSESMLCILRAINQLHLPTRMMWPRITMGPAVQVEMRHSTVIRMHGARRSCLEGRLQGVPGFA